MQNDFTGYFLFYDEFIPNIPCPSLIIAFSGLQSGSKQKQDARITLTHKRSFLNFFSVTENSGKYEKKII